MKTKTGLLWTRWLAWTLVVLAMTVLSQSKSNATLVFYYDPATGNVSFDTTDTRSGAAYTYALGATCRTGSNTRDGPIIPLIPWSGNCESVSHWPLVRPGDVAFRPENHIGLAQSGFDYSDNNYVGDATLSNPWRGLYTIGEILPSGLSESTWKGLFEKQSTGAGSKYGGHGYADVIGGGTPPPAEFVYGAPDGEFKNRWDLVDPDELDWADEVQLIYREMTGELVLQTSSQQTGGYITGFTIDSERALTPENYVSPVESTLSGASANRIYFFADAVEPGEFNLGALLEPGLSAEEYFATITKADFFGRAGFGSSPIDLDTERFPLRLSYQAVPEPIAYPFSLLIVGVLIARRRTK